MCQAARQDQLEVGTWGGQNTGWDEGAKELSRTSGDKGLKELKGTSGDKDVKKLGRTCLN